MLVLGIETTCDETAAAIVENGRKILSDVVSSQIDLHAQYGGVFPELACRRHVDILIPVIDEALRNAHISIKDIDLIAVANGPGLIGALLIGLNAAKGLSLAWNKPIIGINHTEAHLYAALMSQDHPISFPCIGVVLSGGHTALLHMHELGRYSLIGQTHDDAIGEAFDKVARILGLSYPGGPPIEALAQKGNPQKYSFKAGQIKGQPFGFSFSGIKTAVLYASKESNVCSADLAASFQSAAFSDIAAKTIAAATHYGCSTLVFGGGVTNNKTLRRLFAEAARGFNQVWPATSLTLDNAAMIAGLGYHNYLKQGRGDPMTLDVFTRASY